MSLGLNWNQFVRTCFVTEPLLGQVPVHNDAHQLNWLQPVDKPNTHVLLDFEESRIDFAGQDIGLMFMSNGVFG
jgi:thiamine kinase-like enzyme